MEISVCCKGKILKSNFLGQVLLPLKEFNLNSDVGIERIFRLRPKLTLMPYLNPYKGDVYVEIKFIYDDKQFNTEGNHFKYIVHFIDFYLECGPESRFEYC
jgi:hypothetical protein